MSAVLSTAKGLLAPAARLATLQTTSHIKNGAITVNEAVPPDHGRPAMQAAATAALPNQAAEPYIPQQPRMPSPWRRLSPTMPIRLTPNDTTHGGYGFAGAVG